MARQNRVTPEGQIIAVPTRGMFMGNRGILHDAEGRIVTPFRLRAWICCLTSFKGRQRKVMSPGHYTELFFLDEATALAAGHRPCAECRRADYNRFRAAWARARLGDDPRAPEIDRMLHTARIRPRTHEKLVHRAPWQGLPDGAMVRLTNGPALVLGPHLLPWTAGGYAAALPRPGTGDAAVLTPAPIVATLSAGYAPELHSSAGAMSQSR
ncbi:hypothetical protein OEW28_18245 [Defluviimonas sp. WL0002]|uniref:Metal binding domain of Ada n=1 Tax=Albidovulum marisflavi TaxID=2984159 RepID=A0ABT2ZHP2_9RHOB|nr:hypothetical protein [Defluviimonas sp. WL0002]MCV2870558.1 hypothetical protein [Defluviimonas sp. WL0002]